MCRDLSGRASSSLSSRNQTPRRCRRSSKSSVCLSPNVVPVTTSTPSKTILVVDDDGDTCELLQVHFRQNGFIVHAAHDVASARSLLESHEIDLLLSDVLLGQESGLDLCTWLTENRPSTPAVMLTAFGSMETAVGAIRAGAHDFITKPVDLQILDYTVKRALDHFQLRKEIRRLRQASGPASGETGILGESDAIRRLSRLIERVADGDATVLINGESGTGKELVARALHRLSRRKNGPFVAVNCAALPPGVLESELFGHERGAFTDARRAHEGLLRKASGGTLFLDEIGEMSLDVQVKLLRALQERRVRPLGSSQEIPFDARIVCATNRDLETEVEHGRFREDFYYRINVVTLHTPPLRARDNDVLLLAQHFIQSIAERTGKPVRGLSTAVAQRLLEYDWPGNVRQIQNVIERAMALARFDQITVEDLPERIQKYRSNDLVVAGNNPETLITLDELEQRYIERVLSAVGGNKTQAARILGLDRRTLYRKLERREMREGLRRNT